MLLTVVLHKAKRASGDVAFIVRAKSGNNYSVVRVLWTRAATLPAGLVHRRPRPYTQCGGRGSSGL